MQSFKISCLFITLLNGYIVDIKKPYEICSLTFVADKFSGLFLHPSGFSIKHGRCAYIVNGALSHVYYWLNSNILVSSKGIETLQKSLFSYTFYEIHVCFLFQKKEDNSDNKNHCSILTLFLLIITVIFLLQYNLIFLGLETLKI